MTAPDTELMHASAVLLTPAMPFPAGLGLPRPVAVLLRGGSGSGKSDLALRLIGMGAALVADDQVVLSRRDDSVIARAPDSLRGLIELRGLGLVRLESVAMAEVVLVADLVARDAVPRLPEGRRVTLMGCDLAYVQLHAFDASAPLKILAAAAVALAPEKVIS